MRKKVSSVLAQKLIKTIRNRYNLEMSPSRAEDIIKYILWELEKEAAKAIPKGNEAFIFRAYTKYYETTKLPEKEFHKHSAFWFAVYIYQHYELLPLCKKSKSKLRNIIQMTTFIVQYAVENYKPMMSLNTFVRKIKSKFNHILK